jgi:hypothetical protein
MYRAEIETHKTHNLVILCPDSSINAGLIEIRWKNNAGKSTPEKITTR